MLEHLKSKVKEITRTLNGEKDLITSLELQLEAALKRVEGLQIDLDVYGSALEEVEELEAVTEKYSLKNLRRRLNEQKESADHLAKKEEEKLKTLFESALSNKHTKIFDKLKDAEVDSNPMPTNPVHFVVSEKNKVEKVPEKVYTPAPTTVVSNKKKGNKKSKADPKFGHKGFGNKTVGSKKGK